MWILGLRIFKQSRRHPDCECQSSAFSLQGVPCPANAFPCRPPWRDCKVLRYRGASTVRVKVWRYSVSTVYVRHTYNHNWSPPYFTMLIYVFILVYTMYYMIYIYTRILTYIVYIYIYIHVNGYEIRIKSVCQCFHQNSPFQGTCFHGNLTLKVQTAQEEVEALRKAEQRRLELAVQKGFWQIWVVRKLRPDGRPSHER